ncbi:MULTISPECIES: flagellin [unclassified Phenylobacterium]|uniref:flagellin n=1 Tax=unclassified Phenylobacterium TaxID=2640670 RepID=UPI0022B475E7|nr:flagellin [Phenylobacterium sp. NIBR 498073]MBS0492182.1 flagellin [Pseudomonadota bacterium]WGU41633.1 flagellin [Phenylobacterium sp. NIBR 498073]
MYRVTTGGNYSLVLRNIMLAQQKQMNAGDRVATQENGANLKDYSRNAEMLTAMRSVETRIGGYLDQNKLIADKLTTQDFAMTQLGDAAAGTKQAIEEAIATGRTDTLMQEIEAQFRNAVSSMNSRYGGKYLFAGGKIDTMPVTADALSDLTNPLTPLISDFFQNDDFITEHKVDDATTVKTGLLADNLGTDLLQAFKTLQAFHEATPFGGTMTDAQRTFLTNELANWDSVSSDIIDKTARNGMVQARVDDVKVDLTARQNSLKGMIGDIVDANMPVASVELEKATLALQASTQVFITLRDSSLLNALK